MTTFNKSIEVSNREQFNKNDSKKILLPLAVCRMGWGANSFIGINEGSQKVWGSSGSDTERVKRATTQIFG